MHTDTSELRFTLKLQKDIFLGMEHVCLIFSMDLASSLLLLVWVQIALSHTKAVL